MKKRPTADSSPRNHHHTMLARGLWPRVAPSFVFFASAAAAASSSPASCASKSCSRAMSSSSAKAAHYRADGVRITHDPHAPGMAEVRSVHWSPYDRVRVVNADP